METDRAHNSRGPKGRRTRPSVTSMAIIIIIIITSSSSSSSSSMISIVIIVVIIIISIMIIIMLLYAVMCFSCLEEPPPSSSSSQPHLLSAPHNTLFSLPTHSVAYISEFLSSATASLSLSRGNSDGGELVLYRAELCFVVLEHNIILEQLFVSCHRL